MSLFVVMGVSGCGKSSVAEELARSTGGDFVDADDFHPPENKVKMAAGIPLQDEDRRGWLDALNAELKARQDSSKHTFLACSSLRQVYRDRLAAELPTVRFIYLQGTKECIGGRLAARADHFMPPALLESQFATLEEPIDAITVSIDQPLHDVVTAILAKI